MTSDMRNNTRGKCPICAKPVAEADHCSSFCSDRCRLIDLGKWLKGDYTISRPIEHHDIEEGQ